MVYDKLSNLSMYIGLHPDLVQAYEFLLHANKQSIGQHKLNNNGCYANVETYTTQSLFKKRAEIHRQYIDLQYVVSGEELLGYEPFNEMYSCDDFDTEKDIGFYHFEKPIWLTMDPGSFAIIYPHEAHMPGTILCEESAVKKIVVKLPFPSIQDNIERGQDNA